MSTTTTRKAKQSTPTADTTSDTLPHSVEAEQSVLGSIILDNQTWDQVASRLGSSDFFIPAHQIIFDYLSKLSNQNKPIDPIIVSEELERSKKLQECGGINYLIELIENTPTTTNISAYIDIIYNNAQIRNLIQATQEIQDTAYNPGELSSAEVLSKAERAILKISEAKGEINEPIALKDLLRSTIDQIETLFNSDSKLTGITTGFSDLDEITSGLQASDMIVIAARPSMGKTTFAMNLVENALLNTNKNIVVFSLEMPAKHLIMRSLSSLGLIDQTKVRTGKLDEEDWLKLSLAIEKLKDRHLFIDDSAGISPQEIRSKLRTITREHGKIAMVMVDYLQLMRIPGYKENRINEISEISRSLKAIAKEFNVPVITLSQLNRSLEQRPNKRPINSDLRESGAIEQDADLIMFIYRDEVYHPETEQKGIAEIIIGKHRNGPIGVAKLAFLGKYTRFENLSPNIY